jgi:hypothetical protein
MSFKEGLMKFFSNFGMGFVTILQFIARQKLFYIIGFISFGIIIIQSFTLALTQVVSDGNIPLYILKILGFTILNLALSILSIDNHLYKTAIEYSNIIAPTIWTVLKYLILMIKDIFFYIWWWRVFEYIFKNAGNTIGTDTDKSTGSIDLFKLILPKYVIFFTIMNIIGLFSLGVISISTPVELGFFAKMRFFWDTNFPSAFDLIIKLFPFKGLVAFIVFSLGSMVTILTGESLTPTPTNTTINKTI